MAGLSNRSSQNISIHALREEGDPGCGVVRCGIREISIHALREEGDFTGNEVVRDSRYFYPRPPRGGRPSPGTVCLYAVIFLSTPSARRATYELKLLGIDTVISIHALREEGDRPSGGCIHRGTYFYPRPPRGGRP